MRPAELLPDETECRRHVWQIDAIFRHESQKDRALFPGADPREFWQRARDRNRVSSPLPLAYCYG